MSYQFQFGQLFYDQIKGVSSITLCTANEVIQNKLYQFIPTIMLIGDNFKKRLKLYKEKKDINLSSLNLYTVRWLNCIDTIGSSQLQVNYFIESKFDFYYVKMKTI